MREFSELLTKPARRSQATRIAPSGPSFLPLRSLSCLVLSISLIHCGNEFQVRLRLALLEHITAECAHLGWSSVHDGGCILHVDIVVPDSQFCHRAIDIRSNDKGQKAAEKPSGSAGLSAAGPAAEVAAGGFPVYTADSTVHDAILDSTPGLTDQYGMVHCSVCRAYTDQ